MQRIFCVFGRKNMDSAISVFSDSPFPVSETMVFLTPPIPIVFVEYFTFIL